MTTNVERHSSVVQRINMYYAERPVTRFVQQIQYEYYSGNILVSIEDI